MLKRSLILIGTLFSHRIWLPEIRSRGAMVPKVDLMFHKIPMDHTHKEDPQEEVQEVFLSSQAVITKHLNLSLFCFFLL